jgi:hypothetical protein
LRAQRRCAGWPRRSHKPTAAPDGPTIGSDPRRPQPRVRCARPEPAPNVSGRSARPVRSARTARRYSPRKSSGSSCRSAPTHGERPGVEPGLPPRSHRTASPERGDGVIASVSGGSFRTPAVPVVRRPRRGARGAKRGRGVASRRLRAVDEAHDLTPQLLLPSRDLAARPDLASLDRID